VGQGVAGLPATAKAAAKQPSSVAAHVTMQRDLRRTGVTDLTDDELLLFDVLFDKSAPFRLLRKSVFGDQWNCRSHNLDDDQLRDAIDRFCAAGVLESELIPWPDNETQLSYRLTPQGGQLWETERAPVWDRYAVDQYCRGACDEQHISVCALSAGVLEDFLRVGGDPGMWSGEIVRVRRWRITNHMLIPWKSFPQIYAATVVLSDKERSDGPNRWRLYATRRTWWRNTDELQRW
jgi:hypothetical protein